MTVPAARSVEVAVTTESPLAEPEPGRPVVFRNATVLTMDDAHTS